MMLWRRWWGSDVVEEVMLWVCILVEVVGVYTFGWLVGVYHSLSLICPL